MASKQSAMFCRCSKTELHSDYDGSSMITKCSKLGESLPKVNKSSPLKASVVAKKQSLNMTPNATQSHRPSLSDVLRSVKSYTLQTPSIADPESPSSIPLGPMRRFNRRRKNPTDARIGGSKGYLNKHEPHMPIIPPPRSSSILPFFGANKSLPEGLIVSLTVNQSTVDEGGALYHLQLTFEPANMAMPPICISTRRTYYELYDYHFRLFRAYAYDNVHCIPTLLADFPGPFDGPPPGPTQYYYRQKRISRYFANLLGCSSHSDTKYVSNHTITRNFFAFRHGDAIKVITGTEIQQYPKKESEGQIKSKTITVQMSTDYLNCVQNEKDDAVAIAFPTPVPPFASLIPSALETTPSILTACTSDTDDEDNKWRAIAPPKSPSSSFSIDRTLRSLSPLSITLEHKLDHVETNQALNTHSLEISSPMEESVQDTQVKNRPKETENDILQDIVLQTNEFWQDIKPFDQTGEDRLGDQGMVHILLVERKTWKSFQILIDTEVTWARILQGFHDVLNCPVGSRVLRGCHQDENEDEIISTESNITGLAFTCGMDFDIWVQRERSFLFKTVWVDDTENQVV
ncbi:uncharacterized protein L203_102474 [Cryptococcus depauperatus CBS 7841]|uniref:PX domain-containing protein n=1 Tax=Cryptococcus depauperatus CBS 7841 TaxID=1295531 RepID=A0AAJ8JS08_9TREE